MNKPNNNEAGYNLELKEMVEKLKQVNQFFIKYGDKVSKNDTHIISRIRTIDDHLCEAAIEISSLISVEFMENVFYK